MEPMSCVHWRELLHDAATPTRLIPALSAGLMVGLLGIVIELSLASLVFSGPLSAFAANAAGLTLFGGFVTCLVVALCSRFPSSIFLPQDAPAAILAAVAAGIAAGMPAGADPHEAFVTVGAAMALSTLLSGVLFLALGRFGLGNLMRYVPYPVVGGFMAGIGWLLVQGSLSIVTGSSLSLAGLSRFLDPGTLLRLAPAVALALILLTALNRWNSPFILPGTLTLALGTFALYLLATGQSLDDAARAGHLLGGMPQGVPLWPVFTAADLAFIRWDALLAQAPQLCVIPLVASLSILLIASGLETSTRRDLDLRYELTLNAVANALGGLGGAHTGYTALSFSLLGPKTGSDSRLVGVSAALLIGAATFFGAALLGHFPRFILGGVVLFLGVATLLDWVVAVRRQVTRVEYALILAILGVIGTFGFLTGAGFGLVMATVIFVVKYSRLPVVRQDTDASGTASTRRRSVPDRHILRERGGDIRILRVTGYIFFGSANVLGRTVAARLQPEHGPRPGFLILDFAEVGGFDSSAVNGFLRILQRCAAAGCQAVFAAAPATLEAQMRRAAPRDTEGVRFLADLDRALEWCEDALLEREAERLRTGQAAAGRERLFDLAVDDLMLHLEAGERFEALVERLGPGLEPRSAAPGQVILGQGEPAAGVWLVVSGQAEETVLGPGGGVTRLRTLGPGSAAGRTSQETGGRAPGIVTALTDCSLLFLPASGLRRMEAEDPAAALDFYRLIVPLLEARVEELAAARGAGA